MRHSRALLCAIALTACAAEPPTIKDSPALENADTPEEYPAGPYEFAVDATLPNLTFVGVDATGARGAIKLSDYYSPVEGSVLGITVVGGQWCGTCRWLAEHPSSWPADIERLEIVLGDRDNAPATIHTARDWQDYISGDVAVAADPDHQLQPLTKDNPVALPLVILVDRSTMRVLDVTGNPAPDELTYRVRRAMQRLEGRAVTPFEAEPLVDGLFRRNDWDMLVATSELDAPPPDPTNAVADSHEAAALGKELFFDPLLSPSGDVSCASCHDPARQFGDGLAIAEGIALGTRRTPSIALAAHARWQFWDGRADTLWGQALGPFEDPAEMGSSRTFVARQLIERYGEEIEDVFPNQALPTGPDWPTHGKPGDEAFDALPSAEQQKITGLFVAAGKAIAAYERTLRVLPNRMDAYLQGDNDALTLEEKIGLQMFASKGCMQCHWGPRLTDDAFHDVGFASDLDAGRVAALEALSTSPFRAAGPWSDEPAVDAPLPGAALFVAPWRQRQFKTPSLRGVAQASFFGHSGEHAHIAEVMEMYGNPFEPRPDGSTREPWLVPFGETEQWGLVPLLQTMTGEIAERGSANGPTGGLPRSYPVR